MTLDMQLSSKSPYFNERKIIKAPVRDVSYLENKTDALTVRKPMLTPQYKKELLSNSLLTK